MSLCHHVVTVIRVDCSLAFARVFGTDYARSRCILEVIFVDNQWSLLGILNCRSLLPLPTRVVCACLSFRWCCVRIAVWQASLILFLYFWWRGISFTSDIICTFSTEEFIHDCTCTFSDRGSSLTLVVRFDLRNSLSVKIVSWTLHVSLDLQRAKPPVTTRFFPIPREGRLATSHTHFTSAGGRSVGWLVATTDEHSALCWLESRTQVRENEL